MPQIIITEGAVRGLERCRVFLAEKNPSVLMRAGQAIDRGFGLLVIEPGMGRPLDDFPKLRELVISFGDSGYVALYRYEEGMDAVYILAFRHQKDAGY